MNTRLKAWFRIISVAAMYAAMTALFEQAFGSHTKKKGK